LDAVDQTSQRFGIKHLIDVIRGDSNQYIESYGHDELDIYGQGQEQDDEFWSSVIRQTLLNEFLEKDIDNIGLLKLTKKGKKFLNDPQDIMLSRDHDYSTLAQDEESEKEAVVSKAHDENLFELLKGLRKKIAKEKNLPPYVIFQDPSLEEMATTYPTTKEELAQINGVGMGKVTKFGLPFLAAIKKYVEDNDIITASDVVVKSTVNKSKIKIFIIQQIDRKIDLEEIAEAKDLTMSELLDEIEHICYSGTKLNLTYYINQVLDDERQEDIYGYFMSSDSDNIQLALQELGEDEYSEEELRLMRIKFLSEYAN
jgi:ATP-dependent DNA helicase RecQ